MAGAVFLSYAREDAEAARRIADALRAFGQEVWLDQSELRGGDTWDAKIRGQIRACALFIPVISAHTQDRAEGYFRREWKLGVERTHDMASGVAFVVPVVIDDTKESDALVPDEFMRFQWTRLPHGVPTSQFVDQVRMLVENPRKAKGYDSSGAAAAGAATPGAMTGSFPPPRRNSWVVGAVVCLIAGAAAAVYVARRPEPASDAPKPSAVSKPADAAPAADGKSIAVLPFANFSPDKDNEFFADGLQDEIITALAKIHDLKVISRTSVLAYRNPEGRNLKKIGSELAVGTVLEGSVQRIGTQVHLNVQLIDARTDDHLWAESYTKELTDVFSLESTLAQEIAGALKANLTTGEKALIGRKPTQNQEAYDLYLRANVLNEDLSYVSLLPDALSVLSLYERAGAKDPLFSLPHVQASMLHGTLYWFSNSDPTEERRAKALSELEIAKRLAPSDPETRLAQGAYDYTCVADWAAALSEYQSAVVELPNDFQVHGGIARALRRLGRFTDSLAEFEASYKLNPNDDPSAESVVELDVGLHRYPEALELSRAYAERFPHDSYIPFIGAEARLQLDGDWDAFVKAAAALNPFVDDPQILAYRRAMRTGDLKGAEQAISDTTLKSLVNDVGNFSDPVALHRAWVAYLLGRADDARKFAEEAASAYRSGAWTRRLEPIAHMGLAQAEALEGRMDEAVRDGKAALAQSEAFDSYDSCQMRYEYGRILVIANRRDEALSVLSEIVTGMSEVGVPRLLPHEPVWSRLKDDPRFMPIIESAKPL